MHKIFVGIQAPFKARYKEENGKMEKKVSMIVPKPTMMTNSHNLVERSVYKNEFK